MSTMMIRHHYANYNQARPKQIKTTSVLHIPHPGLPDQQEIIITTHRCTVVQLSHKGKKKFHHNKLKHDISLNCHNNLNNCRQFHTQQCRLRGIEKKSIIQRQPRPQTVYNSPSHHSQGCQNYMANRPAH